MRYIGRAGMFEFLNIESFYYFSIIYLSAFLALLPGDADGEFTTYTVLPSHLFVNIVVVLVLVVAAATAAFDVPLGVWWRVGYQWRNR